MSATELTPDALQDDVARARQLAMASTIAALVAMTAVMGLRWVGVTHLAGVPTVAVPNLMLLGTAWFTLRAAEARGAHKPFAGMLIVVGGTMVVVGLVAGALV